MTLRDRVRNATNTISLVSQHYAAVAADEGLPTAQRLAAYDALIEEEVGDTATKRARGLERSTGISRLYLKYEGDNPTGTQKDRIAFAQVRHALHEECDTVSLATCGNYGVAVALAAQLAGLRCRIYIPAGYHTAREPEMCALGATVERLPGTYEEVVEQSSKLAVRHGWYDTNPGGRNAALQLEAYARIGHELAEQLQHDISWCAAPVSNGTLLAGVYRGLQAQGCTTRMLAGSSTHKNPIVESFRAGLQHCRDLDPAKIQETHVNEPLINWHAFDGDHALQALLASNGTATNVSDKNLLAAAALIRKTEGYHVLPASTAGLYGLLRLHEKQALPPATYVAVLTARA